MCERGWRLGVVFALVALVAGGCASSMVGSAPASGDAVNRPPTSESPSNFASPTDLLHRYPTMRRQEL